MIENHPRKKTGPHRKPCPDRVCERCGKTYSRKQGDKADRWAKRKYCSRACHKHYATPPDSCPIARPSEIVALSRAAANRVGNTLHDREDIAQECCLYALSYLRRYSESPEKAMILLSWSISREAREVARIWKSRRERGPKRDDDASIDIRSAADAKSDDVVELAHRSDLIAKAKGIMSGWDEWDRNIFWGYYAEGRTMRELVEMYGGYTDKVALRLSELKLQLSARMREIGAVA